MFKSGFAKGYCYSSNSTSIYCNPPLPPLPPLPIYPETSSSWDDGYLRGFLVGRSRRDQDDYNKSGSSSSTYVAKFNPYVSQNPILNLSPEDRDRYFRMKAAQEQKEAEALAMLLSALFTRKPLTAQEKADIELRKIQKRQDQLRRRNERLQKRENKKLIVGSDRYILCKKSRMIWVGVTAVTATSAALTYLAANNQASKYLSATDNASAIRSKANNLYQIAPVCLAVSSFSFLQFLFKSAKIMNAKPNKNAHISNLFFDGDNVGLTINF